MADPDNLQDQVDKLKRQIEEMAGRGGSPEERLKNLQAEVESMERIASANNKGIAGQEAANALRASRRSLLRAEESALRRMLATMNEQSETEQAMVNAKEEEIGQLRQILEGEEERNAAQKRESNRRRS